MADCECIAGCPFFNDRMANAPALAEMMKRKFCQDDWASCARYRVFKAIGKEAVPGNLFPNMMDEARNLIKEHAG